MLGLDLCAARVVWTVLVFVAALTLVYVLRQVLLLLAFAVVLAYLLAPLVRLAQRWRLLRARRGLAVALVYLVVLGTLVGAGAAIGPRLTRDAGALVRRVPEIARQVQSGELVGAALDRRGWDTTQVRQVEGFIGEHVRDLAGHAQAALTAALAWLARAWVVVLVPIFAFFFLKDGPGFAAATESLLETRTTRGLWRGLVQDAHRVLAEYVRALIVLGLVTFAVWSVVFLALGVPGALGLALLGGALEFIPVVGPVAAAVIVLAVHGFSGGGHFLVLPGFLIGWRLIQDYVTSPLVMGKGVELHPMLIIFGVIAGGEIGGVPGMFLSVPIMAALRLAWRRLHAHHHATTGIPHGAPEVAAPPMRRAG